MMYLGDYAEDYTGLVFYWNTNAVAGESITRATNGTISVYKDGGLTQSTAGVTDTEDFDSLTGVHKVAIDLSADAFYAAGSEYAVVLSAATIDGKAINAVLAHFSIERSGGVLALAKGANGFSAIKTQTASIETKVDTIDDFLDTEIAAIKAKTDNLPTDPADASDIAASFTTVNTKLDTIDDFLDTEIAAIKTKTDQLTFTTANRVDTQVFGIQNDTITAASIAAGAIDRATFAADTGLQSVRSNTGQPGAGPSGIILDASASSLDNFYRYHLVYLTGGTGAGQSRLITSYSGFNKVASVSPNWEVEPDGTTTFAILPFGLAWTAQLTDGVINSSTFSSNAISATTLAPNAIGANQLAANAVTEIVTAVWASASRTITELDEDVTTIDLDASIRAAIGLGAADLDAQLAAIDNFIDTEVASILAAVDTEVAAIKTKTDQLTFTTVNRVDASTLGMDATVIDNIWDEIMEGTTTARQSMRLANSANGAKTNGGGTATFNVRDLADTKNRVTATVDSNGNRSVVTRDLT